MMINSWSNCTSFFKKIVKLENSMIYHFIITSHLGFIYSIVQFWFGDGAEHSKNEKPSSLFEVTRKYKGLFENNPRLPRCWAFLGKWKPRPSSDSPFQIGTTHRTPILTRASPSLSTHAGSGRDLLCCGSTYVRMLPILLILPPQHV